MPNLAHSRVCESHFNPLHAKLLQKEQKHIFTFYVIPPHWYDTGSWNPSSCKTRTRTYLFYIVNITAADVNVCPKRLNLTPPPPPPPPLILQDFADFADDILLHENCCILFNISLKFVSNSPINNKPALVKKKRGGGGGLVAEQTTSHCLNQWRHYILMHICVTLSQWVKQHSLFGGPSVHRSHQSDRFTTQKACNAQLEWLIFLTHWCLFSMQSMS